MLRIHDILVWIRIRGSMTLTNPDVYPAIFVSDLQDANKKLIVKKSFPAYFFLNVHLHLISKIKSQSNKTEVIKVFLTFLLDDRRKWIRIQDAQKYRSGSATLEKSWKKTWHPPACEDTPAAVVLPWLTAYTLRSHSIPAREEWMREIFQSINPLINQSIHSIH